MRQFGEFVLDRLEFSDRLPELVTLLGVVHGQLERPPGRAMCPRQQCRLGLEAEIVEIDASSGRSVSGAEFSRTSHSPQAPMARVGTTSMPGASSWMSASLDASTATRRCVAPAASTKRSTPVRAPTVDADRARAGIRIAGAEAECGHRRAGVQLFEQLHRGVGP